MDWGLAKVLAEGGIHDEERASRAHQEPQETVIRTARSTGSHGTFGTDTEAGSILGTPAYMPPEQASGDIAHLDRRADVFGLGAILCEILTGKPPYLGRSSEEVRRKAANGDLADATARLDACGADAELIALDQEMPFARSDRPAEGCPGGGRRAVGLPGRRAGAAPDGRARAGGGAGARGRGAEASQGATGVGGIGRVAAPGRRSGRLVAERAGRCTQGDRPPPPARGRATFRSRQRPPRPQRRGRGRAAGPGRGSAEGR